MKKICIIHTGGTIAMERNTNDVLVPMLEQQDLQDFIPGISSIADLSSIHLFDIDSSDMNPKHWVQIAEKINEVYEEYDGFVVLHGTDTMAYSATALSFMLGNLGKPVVLTGSQVPIKEIASDGRNNLTNAIRVACQNIAEVSIMFGNFLLRGNRAVKLHEFTLDSFDSPNFKPLSKMGVELRIDGNCYRRHAGVLELKTNLVTDVAVIRLFPGITNEQILGMVPPRTKGVVIEGYGAGNVPLGEDGIQQSIDAIIDQGIIVVINTQCIWGGVEYYRYAGGAFTKSKGALSSGNMTAEATIIKLMWVLGQSTDRAEITDLYQRNLVGELTELR